MKLRLNAGAGLLGILVASCGGGGTGGTGAGGAPMYGTTGMLGNPSSAVVGANLVFASAALNGTAELHPGLAFGMLIDTGSPVVLVDPTFFNMAPPTTSAEIMANIDLGLLDASGNTVVTLLAIPALELSNAMMDTLGFGGILGGDVMRQFSVQLNYASPMDAFRLGDSGTEPSGVETPGGMVGFTLAGGGQGQVTLSASAMPIVTLPATRIPLTVTIEGQTYRFILDTGASEVSVRTSVFGALTADSRPKLSGFQITTVMGGANASVTRAKSITIAGETVTNVPVMTIPGDSLLDSIGSDELHYQLDGLLGGSFLRNFLVTIDYPNGQLHLQRYTTETWVDEFQRVGIGLGATPLSSVHWYNAGVVYAGTDAAAKGIAVGDEIVSVDGAPLDGLDPITADNFLNGTPGTTKVLGLGATQSPSLANTSVTVLVDDLIPSP